MEECYGMSMDKFLELGYGWVVQRVQVEYKRPLKLGDTFSVETGIISIAERGCKVEFEITNLSTHKISASGWFDFVMIDLKTGRGAIIPDAIIAHYSI